MQPGSPDRDRLNSDCLTIRNAESTHQIRTHRHSRSCTEEGLAMTRKWSLVAVAGILAAATAGFLIAQDKSTGQSGPVRADARAKALAINLDPTSGELKSKSQAARRHHAVLAHLLQVLPESRKPALQQELELLERATQRAFADEEARAGAAAGDLQGIGGSEASSRSISRGPFSTTGS
jgi:hypothetical protein